MPQQQTGFDVDRARKDGYSDDQIIEYLTKTRKFDVQKALKDGHSKPDIISYLAGKSGNKDQSFTSLVQSGGKGTDQSFTSMIRKTGTAKEGPKYSVPFGSGLVKPEFISDAVARAMTAGMSLDRIKALRDKYQKEGNHPAMSYLTQLVAGVSESEGRAASGMTSPFAAAMTGLNLLGPGGRVAAGMIGGGTSVSQMGGHRPGETTADTLERNLMASSGLFMSAADVASGAPSRQQIGEFARNRGAEIGTKAARPTPEMQEMSGSPTATGRAVAEANIITSRKKAIGKISQAIDKIKTQRDADSAQLEKMGYKADVEKLVDAEIAKGISKNTNPQAKNAIQKFADAIKYETVKNAKGQFEIDYNRPRNLKSMTPSEVNKLIDSIDEYAYSDTTSQKVVEPVARKTRFAVSEEMGKNIPGYSKAGRQMRDLIDAKDSYQTQINARAADKGRQIRTIFEAGVAPIAAYEALRLLGTSTGVSAAAYPTVLAMVKVGMSTPSRTLRAVMWNKIGEIMDPQGVTGQWPTGPSAAPAPKATVANPAAPYGPATSTGTGAPVTASTSVNFQNQPGGGTVSAGGPAPRTTVAKPAAKAAAASAGGEGKVGGTPEQIISHNEAFAKAKSEFTEKNPGVDPTESSVMSGIAKRAEEIRKADAQRIQEKNAKAQGKVPLTDEEKAAKVEAAKTKKREADAARMQSRRAMARTEMSNQAKASLAEGGGTSALREAISSDFTPEQHVMFIEKAEGILKQINPENYKLYESVVKGQDAQKLSPADKRDFLVGLIEASQEKK